MFDKEMRDAWHARERAVPISPVLNLAPEGLVLGAGTVLVAAEGERRLRSVQGEQARVLALLSAAYGAAVKPSVLSNIERAAKCWREGDDCLAYIHLAHTGLAAPRDPRAAACRLFVTDLLMKAGVSSRIVFEALEVGAAYIEAVEKLYNPERPRVPAGSGRTSGEWTRVLSWLGDLTAEQIAELGTFALRFGGAAAAFGLLFIPSPNKVRVEGEVPEIRGLRYSWNRDETLLHLTYDAADGPRIFTAQLEGDLFRDPRGRVIGRALPGGAVAIDPAAISADLVQEDEPKLCPAPGPDKPGGSEKGRDYEDYVKKFVNPESPTPRGWGFQLPNPTANGKLVFYDDCQHSTGMMVEAKGLYVNILAFPQGKKSVTDEWLDESGRQVAGRGTRELRWYFAEPAAAEFARKLFNESDKGREAIEIEVLPWPESEQ